MFLIFLSYYNANIGKKTKSENTVESVKYCLSIFCNLNVKDHIWGKINCKKCLYMKSVLFWFAENYARSGPYNKILSCLRLISISNFRRVLFVHRMVIKVFIEIMVYWRCYGYFSGKGNAGYHTSQETWVASYYYTDLSDKFLNTAINLWQIYIA